MRAAADTGAYRALVFNGVHNGRFVAARAVSCREPFEYFKGPDLDAVGFAAKPIEGTDFMN